MDPENKLDSEKTAPENHSNHKKNSNQAKKAELEHTSHSDDWSSVVLEYHYSAKSIELSKLYWTIEDY